MTNSSILMLPVYPADIAVTGRGAAPFDNVKMIDNGLSSRGRISDRGFFFAFIQPLILSTVSSYCMGHGA